MGNIIFLILILVSFVGLYKLFQKAGIAPWKALIPVYNFCVASKMINKPWWWGLIMAVPGVNVIMYGVYGFNIARAFKKRTTGDLVFASLLPYIFFVKIGFDPKVTYFGVKDIRSESAFVKNWLDPIIFAVVAASIIRTFFFEAFTIPTSSLEKSLMVGDFLFVNKVCYGAKVPQTPLSFPFAHHTLPLTKTTKSYLEWVKLPYMRLPGYSSPKNGEIVVFNYPDGDTVALNMQNRSYYQVVREIADGYRQQGSNATQARSQAWHDVNDNPQYYGAVVGRPVDKRDHYVKRCVAIAGDKLEIKDGDVYINDTKQAMPEKAQHHYFVKARTPFVSVEFLDRMDIYVPEAGFVNLRSNGKDTMVTYSFITNASAEVPLDEVDWHIFKNTFRTQDTVVYCLNMTEETANTLRQNPAVYSVMKRIDMKGKGDPRIFPHSAGYAWNNDNFGPFVLPKAGATVKIDTGNICLYEKILNTYDNGIHQVSRNGAQVLYDGQPITSYTFKQDYYWMMGDNRHNSADSRSWGVVPFDHVVGRPVFVWFSMKDPENNPISGASTLGSLFKNSKEGRFRWERFMCYVGEKGLVSWKIPVLVLVLGIWGWSYWNKKRKQKKAAEKK